MGTRCLIGKHNKETDTVDFIYCQFDGYPEGVGSKLNTEYWSKACNIDNLISRGDLIGLHEDLSSSRFFLTDRESKAKGKKNAEFRTKTATLEDWGNDIFGIGGIEWVYLNINGIWITREIRYN